MPIDPFENQLKRTCSCKTTTACAKSRNGAVVQPIKLPIKDEAEKEENNFTKNCRHKSKSTALL